jgi:hypothetical protein
MAISISHPLAKTDKTDDKHRKNLMLERHSSITTLDRGGGDADPRLQKPIPHPQWRSGERSKGICPPSGGMVSTESAQKQGKDKQRAGQDRRRRAGVRIATYRYHSNESIALIITIIITRWFLVRAGGRGIRSRVREEEWEGDSVEDAYIRVVGKVGFRDCFVFCVFVLFVFALLFVPNSGGLLCYLGVLRRSASAFFLPFLSSPINDIDCVLLVLFYSDARPTTTTRKTSSALGPFPRTEKKKNDDGRSTSLARKSHASQK